MMMMMIVKQEENAFRGRNVKSYPRVTKAASVRLQPTQHFLWRETFAEIWPLDDHDVLMEGERGVYHDGFVCCTVDYDKQAVCTLIGFYFGWCGFHLVI